MIGLRPLARLYLQERVEGEQHSVGIVRALTAKPSKCNERPLNRAVRAGGAAFTASRNANGWPVRRVWVNRVSWSSPLSDTRGSAVGDAL